MPTARKEKGANHAFTLVELLVVLAVLMVLSALLLPAVNRSRSKARAIYCVNNLKQWGVAYHLYANDWKDFLPTEGSASSPAAPGAWYNTLPPYLGKPSYKDIPGQGSSIQQFAPLHIWVCPEKIFQSPTSSSGQNAYFYAMNERINKLGSTNLGHVTRFWIRYPAETVFLFDVKAHSPSGEPTASFSRYPYRDLHGKGCHFLFADGRVAWFPTAAYFDGTSGVLNHPGLRWDAQ